MNTPMFKIVYCSVCGCKQSLKYLFDHFSPVVGRHVTTAYVDFLRQKVKMRDRCPCLIPYWRVKTHTHTESQTGTHQKRYRFDGNLLPPPLFHFGPSLRFSYLMNKKCRNSESKHQNRSKPPWDGLVLYPSILTRMHFHPPLKKKMSRPHPPLLSTSSWKCHPAATEEYVVFGRLLWHSSFSTVWWSETFAHRIHGFAPCERRRVSRVLPSPFSKVYPCFDPLSPNRIRKRPPNNNKCPSCRPLSHFFFFLDHSHFPNSRICH